MNYFDVWQMAETYEATTLTIIDLTSVQLTNKPGFTKNLLVVWNYFKHYFGLDLLYQTPMTVAVFLQSY